ncbi:FtsW/RodA/SpoVE family cell cycle protein [Bacillus sp. IITD106]|nr:FtsW/RodA/SpoVE family cell cycle protein [Bacillus sp. IITD106]
MNEKHSSHINEFLQRVKNQIQSKEAKEYVEQELQTHILQRKKVLLHEGYSEEEAEKQVLEQMGNPSTLGREMHQIHKPKVDWILIGLFTMVLLIGTVPYYFTFEYTTPFLSKRLIYSIFGLTVAIAIMFIDYRKVIRLWPLLFGIGIALSLYIALVGEIRNGRGYLLIGNVALSFWPIAIIFIFSFIGMLSSFYHERKRLWVATFVMFWFPILLILKNSNPAIAVFYFITLLIVLGFSKVSKRERILLILSQCFIILSGILALPISHVYTYSLVRIRAFLNPESDSDGVGFLSLQLQKIMKESSWWGGQEASSYLIPNSHTENAFATIVAHLGWIFGILLIACIGVFVLRMAQTILQTKDHIGIMLVIACVTIIGLSAVWNISMLLGILPLLEIPLPFVSYGGQFQMIHSILIGFILSVYRRKNFIHVQSV